MPPGSCQGLPPLPEVVGDGSISGRAAVLCVSLSVLAGGHGLQELHPASRRFPGCFRHVEEVPRPRAQAGRLPGQQGTEGGEQLAAFSLLRNCSGPFESSQLLCLRTSPLRPCNTRSFCHQTHPGPSPAWSCSSRILLPSSPRASGAGLSPGAGLCGGSSAKGVELPLSPPPRGMGLSVAHTNWLNFEPDFCTRVSFGLIYSGGGG